MIIVDTIIKLELVVLLALLVPLTIYAGAALVAHLKKIGIIAIALLAISAPALGIDRKLERAVPELASVTRFGTVASNDSAGKWDWSNPDLALAEDSAVAFVGCDSLSPAGSCRSNSASRGLSVSGFGFEIPDNATITSVIVSVRRFKESELGGYVSTYQVQLRSRDRYLGLVLPRGNPSTQWYVPWTTAPVVELTGGSPSSWMNDFPVAWEPVTPAALNDPEFSVRYLVVLNVDGLSGRSVAAFVDYVAVTVEYEVLP